MPDKPALPARMFDPFPRIEVDTAYGEPFARILGIARSVADGWVLGPEGPFKKSQPMSEITRHTLTEALLHLLELGLIDIDVDRLNAARGIPTRRSTLREEETDRA